MTITSYAAGSDFLARYDARLTGDLVSDSGTRVTADLADNVNLQTALSDGYGQIVSTIVVGGRYTVAQLDPSMLSPTALSYLVRLNCDLALIFLKRRRGQFSSEKDAELLKDTTERLKALKDGAGVLLGIQDLEAVASVISMAQPQLIPITQRNTIRTRTHNYYPQRSYGERTQYTGNGQ